MRGSLSIHLPREEQFYHTYPKSGLCKGIKKKTPKKQLSSFPSCHKQGMKVWQRYKTFAPCQNEILKTHFNNYFRKHSKRQKRENITGGLGGGGVGAGKSRGAYLAAIKSCTIRLPGNREQKAAACSSQPPESNLPADGHPLAHLRSSALRTASLQLHSKGKPRAPGRLAPFCAISPISAAHLPK